MPRFERLRESKRRLHLCRRECARAREGCLVSVDRSDRLILSAPDAPGASARILWSADLLSRLTRIVAEQIPALAPVDPPLLDDGAAIVERLRLNPDRGPREHLPRRRTGQRLGGRRVEILHIEIVARRDQYGGHGGEACHDTVASAPYHADL